MLIFGHQWIPSPVFTKVEVVEEIKRTPSNSIIILDILDDSSYRICTHCKENDVHFAIIISSLTDAIIASNLGASYAICYEKDKALKLQKLADNYLFDMKMLFVISTFDEIEEFGGLGVDGVLFKSSISAIK
jgi:hypothetical protein